MMPDESDTQPAPFGSAYRRGRDDPRYQIGRLRMLCKFNAHLIDTYARQLRDQKRRMRQVWDAKNWQEQQARNLQNQIIELEKVAEDQRAWIAKLEETHAGTTRELKDWIGQIEEAKAYFARQLESEKAGRAELERLMERLGNTWLGRMLIRRIQQRDQHARTTD